jgi:hypothetical protein
MAGSSSSKTATTEILAVGSSKGKSPVDPAAPAEVKNNPLVPPVDPAAPAKGQKTNMKKKVRMPQCHMNRLMTVEKWEPLPQLGEDFLKRITALIPNGEEVVVNSGFSLDMYRQLDNSDNAVKAQIDMIAEIREQYQQKGYVEMEVTDDDEGDIKVPTGKGRRRFRAGVAKKADGVVNKLN